MMNHKFVVSGLAEYYDIISEIAKQNDIKVGEPLWFRGHSYESYNLLPSILRKDSSSDKINTDETYTSGNLREDYRLQNYKARVFHLTANKPSSKMEWQALYQHNFGKTRLLDWSESARTALSFALEAFVDPRELMDLEEQRKTITPTVWVLKPRALNQKVYKYIATEMRINAVEKALDSVGLSVCAKDICNTMSSFEDYFSLASSSDDISINGILNLSVIDEQRHNLENQLEQLIRTGEFNPFFYLCLRFYVDALPVILSEPDKILPPLAILHQYQSERIRAQRGVFTFFPNYYLQGVPKVYKQIGIDCRNLENQSYVEDCLYEIRITNPNKVAKELLYTGERRTELYPENEYYVHTLEASKFYV
ncbi:MAG: FRG domain-containing protein [Lachnospiraceae bacterium]|nr:FRG domain-containing protein [Lachnospiraceae bacterium]